MKDIVIFHSFLSHQAESFEEAISIVNRNRYWIVCHFLYSHSSCFFLYCLHSWEKSYASNRYGNGASIFTESGIAARKFQTEIEAGQVTLKRKYLIFSIYIYIHT